jgi:hypothetical protein
VLVRNPAYDQKSWLIDRPSRHFHNVRVKPELLSGYEVDAMFPEIYFALGFVKLELHEYKKYTIIKLRGHQPSVLILSSLVRERHSGSRGHAV